MPVVGFDFIEWDDEDDPRGNVQHIALNGLVPDEVEDVLYDSTARDDVSRSTGKPIRFGWTSTDRFIAVVYVVRGDPGFRVAYPVTAYDIDPRA